MLVFLGMCLVYSYVCDSVVICIDRARLERKEKVLEAQPAC